MEPRSFDGGADRPTSAQQGQTGRVVVVGPYLRTRKGDADAGAGGVRATDARLDEAAGLE